MDDPHETPPQTSDNKNVLPDVVHFQQFLAVDTIAADANAATSDLDTSQNVGNEAPTFEMEDVSHTESISEHIPSKIEYSISESENVTNESPKLLKVESKQEKTRNSSLNIQTRHSPISENPSAHDPSRQSSSWPLDVNAASDVHHLSEESPVNLALSSDLTHESKSHSVIHSPELYAQEENESPRTDQFLDSLNEESGHKSIPFIEDNVEFDKDSIKSDNSGSEEIIKLDIRGQGVPKFSLQASKIIFGLPPEGSNILEPNVEPIPVFQQLLSPFLVGAGDNVKVEEVFVESQQSKEPCLESVLHSDNTSPDIELSPDKSISDKMEESDLLVEEMTVDDAKEKESEKQEEPSMPTQPKSMAPDETMSLSTLTTDYKTICEEYYEKLVHLEDAIKQRDNLIQELKITLQQSVDEKNHLRDENDHLTIEVQNLQHIVGERSQSEHGTIKAQLSDFFKYQNMVKGDSTKFHSANMSGGSSMHSSNGEKDMDREEITINYSKSDLRSSGSSEEFQTEFDNKLTVVLAKYVGCIEENLQNKLRESLTQLLCEEIGKIRIESDTNLKDFEVLMHKDKRAYTIETRKLRDLLAAVKTDNADINALRQELKVKHEKEMENLRTYFEKKCSDMERSYSEEVWRGVARASSCGSVCSAEGDYPEAAGDYVRRRTRSADLPSLTAEPSQLEQALSQSNKKHEQQLDELKIGHVTYMNDLRASHREVVASLEEQITQLKAQLQTVENTETNVSLYQQDIDLELEKESQLERKVYEARQEVLQQLQDQIEVLLSDPDAELSGWPLDLVALRDKIHGDAARVQQEKELSSLRDDTVGEVDKWKQRRNHSFDQNRHLEEVTKERDDLKRVTVALQCAVSQLVAYFAAAEDELNTTLIAQFLGTFIPDESSEDDVRFSTPNLSTSLNTSAVSLSRGKHVHFAPDLQQVLTDLDEEGILGFLQQQRDLNADIKRELEHSLRRLRNEAQDLLQLSAKLAVAKVESKPVECGEVQITELVQELDDRQRSCDNCQLHRKNMEEAMSECLQRENLLRSDLEAAMLRIAHLMTSADRPHSTDLIAEGYGQHTISLPIRPSRPRPLSESGATSLDNCSSPRARAHVSHMQHDIDLLLRERDDLQQQVKRMTDSPVHKVCCEKLEAANRQLRSTRQFVEEQAAEREVERDEFANRLAELRDENSRLATRLQNNVKILNEVEQLEAQTREMNQIITELETRKASTDAELKATDEKISILRDIIANLESQLEQKTAHESKVLEQLEDMKKTIDERDSKMRALVGELDSLRSERVEQSDVTCVKCAQEEDKYSDLLEKIKEQTRWLEDKIHRRTQKLERIHEVCSASCSEPSEDVSLRDQKNPTLEAGSPPFPLSPRVALSELSGICECLSAHARAEDAALKRMADLEMQLAQLKDVAQEVRAERDVLQARMSEQALKISSLSARLETQRNNAEALAHHAASQLSVQLHDALAEVQRLKEELESKDKHLARLKQNLDEKSKRNDQHTVYGNSCNPKDKVLILERELSAAQSRIAQLETLAKSLETDKDELHANLRNHQRALAEKEEQLQELLALKLDDNQKDEKSENEGGKASARTLSDIVSISEFDEQDLQMRRAELKAKNISISDAPYPTDTRDKTHLNRTLPPDLQQHSMSSLNIEYVDHSELPNYTPRADSLPAHLTSTQNKDILKQYKRNVNETTVFSTIDKHGNSVNHSTDQNIQDNCSLYPNRNVSADKDVSVEPKKINFSLEPSNDNKIQDEQDFTSLGELGITLDVKQEHFPDILTQLKHEIKKSRTELDDCKSQLKHAEEQLCDFPALKEEVEELKGLLENTMVTMENDKKFYENQLENFSSNKKLLEHRVAELTQEVAEKSKDLHLLKEDILRRENMILELAKEKRNLTNKMTELEVKIDELQSRNTSLQTCESENHQMREKVSEFQKLEQLVSEKNQQIDSLNQHLDRLDDLQRCLNDRTEELENLKEAFEEKSNELFNLQDTVEALNRDISTMSEDNKQLNVNNKELRLKLTKLEKEQENASLKLQNSESELERVNSLNNELSTKNEELKLLTDKLKDKETEIDILNEDIKCFHEEIAFLKEQLKMVSRSPSPRSKNGDEKRTPDRQVSSDKRQLVKIRKQISLLQHELDFNKKELNDKAFELAKSKFSVTELKNELNQVTKQAADRDVVNMELRQKTDTLQNELQQLQTEKQQLADSLEIVLARINEESNIEELKMKLQEKVQRCRELENELQEMRELMDRASGSTRRSRSTAPDDRALVVSGTRSPTAELERALRDQLNYSHRLDEDIMEQILSGSSDEHEEIPRLALNTSKSSSSIHSSSSDRVNRLRVENDKLHMQVSNLEARLKDKDALITELNTIRDKLVQDLQSAKLRYEAERENSGRLQLLLDTHKETSESLQNQDSNMIQILKKRLESAMQSELELQQREQQQRARVTQLERQLLEQGGNEVDSPLKRQLHHEMESKDRLKGEISLLKSKLEVERTRMADLQAMLEHTKNHYQRELDARSDACSLLRSDLAEIKRLKHDSGVELLRAKELVNIQSGTISELEKKLSSVNVKQKPDRHISDALTVIEGHKSELAREIATLKQCLTQANNPELHTLRTERQHLLSKVEGLERELYAKQTAPEEKDQAIRYLHGRCLRLESCRKALVWQKRYLQRILAGYIELERNLLLPSSRTIEVSSGKKRFKCIATMIIVVVRMGFLVRRRQQVRALSANCILRPPRDLGSAKTTPSGQYTCHSPPSRDTPASRPHASHVPLARRVLKHDVRLNVPASPALGEFIRRSPCYNTNSPHDEPFILNSPRGDAAATYINRLEFASRRLNQAMDASRDVS